MKTVLLIEPDAKLADTIKKYLESTELEVNVVGSAQDAINSADQKTPDAIILELAIPDQNGIAFLHEFRSYGDWTKIPVVVHTHLAISQNTTEKAWRLLGVNKSLYKPSTSLKLLRKTVLDCLQS